MKPLLIFEAICKICFNILNLFKIDEKTENTLSVQKNIF